MFIKLYTTNVLLGLIESIHASNSFSLFSLLSGLKTYITTI